MSRSWKSFLAELKATTGFTQADDLKNLLEQTQKDPLGFLMVQGEMLEMYLEQFANNEITTDEFRASVAAIRDLIEIESVKMSPDALLRAKNMMRGIETLMLGSLLPKIMP